MITTRYAGAWLTDIDDTLVESGETPGDEWIAWLADNIRILKQNNILWIPMSGVALVKLGPRILFRLPKDLLSHVMYYGGDGSQKYYFSEIDNQWLEDDDFTSLFSPAQGIAILGLSEYKRALDDIYRNSESAAEIVEHQLERGFDQLKKASDLSADGLLRELMEILESEGYDPEKSEIYFRGGSVSWMIFGDVSAEPYKEENAKKVRNRIIRHAEEWLRRNKGLASLGERAISIPFPGARGIKFVLVGNDKEKATRDIVDVEKIDPRSILFVGNELFKGGNDNMIRNIDGVSLLSVGEKTDEGRNVVYGGRGVEANRQWMDSFCEGLENGNSWPELLQMMMNECKA